MANPYRGNIDVSTDRGFKLWDKATKGLPDKEKYDLSQAKIKNFKAALDEACNTFHWGTIIQAVPLTHDAEGNVTQSANLLTQSSQVTTQIIRENAQQIWGNTNGDHVIDTTEADPQVLQQRVRSSMISAWLKNSLTTSAKQKLALKSELYRHYNPIDGSYEDDGATMIAIIFDTANPSTTVGVSNLKSKLMQVNLSDYNQNVKNMLDEMELTYNEIIRKGGTHDNFILNLFNAIETSDNENFLKFVGNKRDD